jgi:adenosylhomocysteine nucleosidase
MSATIGVIVALADEMAGLPEALESSREETPRGRECVVTGELWGSPAALTVCGVGLASAARAATTLIERHGVERVLLSGTAGAWGSGVGLGDVVVVDRAYNWDFNAEPIAPRFVIPGADGRGGFETDDALREQLTAAAQAFVGEDLDEAVPDEVRRELGISSPKVIVGTVATGQTLILSRADRRVIRTIPDVRCLDFESAAVAQVCWELGVPVGIVRGVSNTTRNAAEDFSRFLSGAAGHYTTGILRRLLA